MAERQQFQDIATDTEFQNMLATQTAIGQIINHPKTQAILNEQEIVQQLQQTDLNDLLEYLKTGESPKFAEIRILGRWQLEPYATLLQEKRRRSRVTTAEMKLLKQQLEFVKSYALVVTPDNNVKLKGAAPTAAPAAPPSPAIIAAEIAKLPTVVLADGSWKGENDKYQLTLTAQAGGFRFDTGKKSATVEASIKDGRLYLAEENEIMVMEKF